MTYYENARAIHTIRNETRNIAVIEINIAYIAQAQGHYRRALRLLHGVLGQVADQLPLEATIARRDMIECYLCLNRHREGRDLARQVIADYRAFNAAYETARTLLHLATGEAELGNFTAACAALDEAETIFSSMGATTWTATTRLWRGRMALRLGDTAAAYREAVTAATCFESAGQQVNYAAATLLQGQALLALKDLPAAATMGASTLRIAQRYNVPSLRYAAHLLLGQIAETRHAIPHAIRRYQAAAATTERVQRGLTITLRPGFLADKAEAWRALIVLHLRSGQVENAFEAL
ncbi:MAG: hypothetical protein AAB658_11145, partial [Chloroflexota bacterium]